MQILILLAIASIGVWVLVDLSVQRDQKRSASTRAASARGLTAEARHYVEHLNQSRAFPTVDLHNVTTQPGEFGVLHESSTLFEPKSRRAGGAARVEVGNSRDYAGGFQSLLVEDFQPTADGDLYLTNARILFVGGARSVSITFNDPIALVGELGVVRVHSPKHRKTYLFRVSNSLLWSLVAKVVGSCELTNPRMPEGLLLEFSTTQNGNDAEIRLRPSDG